MRSGRFTVDPHILDNTDLSKVDALRHWQHQISVLLEQLQSGVIQLPDPPNSSVYYNGYGQWSTAGGATGPPGPQGVNAYTTTTAPFTVPTVGASTTVSVVDASWIIVGEYLWVDQAGGGPGKAGILQCTGKSANVITLTNPYG